MNDSFSEDWARLAVGSPVDQPVRPCDDMRTDQPTNDELVAATQWASGHDDVNWPERHRLQQLRNARTSWYGAEDMALRYRIDTLLGNYWLRNDHQHALSVFGADTGPGSVYCDAFGIIRTTAPGGWPVEFSVMTTTDELVSMLKSPNVK